MVALVDLVSIHHLHLAAAARQQRWREAKMINSGTGGIVN